MKATVKVYEEGKEILSKVFAEGVYRAGRSDFADIYLPSENISRSHLELRVGEAAVYMTNMSGAGRVKLNGRPTETAEVGDGDELGVGPYRIVVLHGERDADAPAPDAGAGANVEGEGGGFGGGGEGGEGGGFGGGGEGGEGGGFGGGFGGEPQVDENAQAPLGEALLEPDAPQPMPYSSAEPPALEGTAALDRLGTQVEMRPVVAKLLFTEGPRAGEELYLEAYEVTFGRSKRADIYLDDEKLSRIHAKVTRVGMGYRLIDMNSRNGTYVNGMRVLEHPLNSFDVIEIGNSKIKFLISDLVASEMQKAGAVTTIAPASPLEQTKSLQLGTAERDLMIELQRPAGPPAFPPSRPSEPDVFDADPQMAPPKRNLRPLLYGILVLGAAAYFLLPNGTEKPNTATKGGAKTAAVETTGGEKGAKNPVDVKVPPQMPKEYADLTPEAQRRVEGLYNSAIKSAEKDQLEEAVANLRKIHEVLPYYKGSRDLQDQWSKRLKEKQIAEAQQKAKSDEKQDLQIYIDEGMEYLKEGDFERAAESFQAAITIDPNNQLAAKGLKAAEYKVRSVEQIPPDRDPEQDKRKLVAELFQKAVAAFTNKSYQEAIDTADKIRQIELKGDTQYLNEAKQIIDRAKMLQKEEFEPFLIQAKEKYAEGDYNASRDLCEEMLKRDSAYEEAQQCVLKAKKQLNRLAREAYTHGYILESMNRLEEMKQYMNRAKNYVRPGDEYYDKVNKKLEQYQ